METAEKYENKAESQETEPSEPSPSEESPETPEDEPVDAPSEDDADS